ncbi:hypothetical protein GQR58_002566 [Nymphon striatum]|nr:hypothetical protein GQR58_002566 [Nymphon striatum]
MECKSEVNGVQICCEGDHKPEIMKNPDESVRKVEQPKSSSKCLEDQDHEHEISKYNIVAQKRVSRSVSANIPRESSRKNSVGNLKNQEIVAKLQAAIDSIRDKYIRRHYSKITTNPSDEEEVGVHQHTSQLNASGQINDSVFASEHIDAPKVASTATSLADSCENDGQKPNRDNKDFKGSNVNPSEGSNSTTKDEKKNQEIVQKLQKAIDLIRVNYIRKLKRGYTFSDDEETIGNGNYNQSDINNNAEEYFSAEIDGLHCA